MRGRLQITPEEDARNRDILTLRAARRQHVMECPKCRCGQLCPLGARLRRVLRAAVLTG